MVYTFPPFTPHRLLLLSAPGEISELTVLRLEVRFFSQALCGPISQLGFFFSSTDLQSHTEIDQLSNID